MDEHQQRIVGQMLDRLDGYEAWGISLAQLVRNLEGLLGAADIRSGEVVDAFWGRITPLLRHVEFQDDAAAPAAHTSQDALAEGLTC